MWEPSMLLKLCKQITRLSKDNDVTDLLSNSVEFNSLKNVLSIVEMIKMIEPDDKKI